MCGTRCGFLCTLLLEHAIARSAVRGSRGRLVVCVCGGERVSMNGDGGAAGQRQSLGEASEKEWRGREENGQGWRNALSLSRVGRYSLWEAGRGGSSAQTTVGAAKGTPWLPTKWRLSLVTRGGSRRKTTDQLSSASYRGYRGACIMWFTPSEPRARRWHLSSQLSRNGYRSNGDGCTLDNQGSRPRRSRFSVRSYLQWPMRGRS